LVLQVALPVPAGSAFDMTFLVDARVDVNLDEAQAGIVGVLGNPLGGYQCLGLCLRAQFQSSRKMGIPNEGSDNERDRMGAPMQGASRRPVLATEAGRDVGQ